MKTFSAYLQSITRSTRGQNSREITFSGIVTEVQSVDAEGKPEFTSPRKAKAGEAQKEPDPVMVPISIDLLPTAAELYTAICEVLGNVDEAIRRSLAKMYNAIVFAAQVEATAAVVIDSLTPIFDELGITDEAAQTKLRRSVSTVFNTLLEQGLLVNVESPERIAEVKGKLLRQQFVATKSL